MNRDDDFNHVLEAWLRGRAPTQAPDRVLDAALERVGSESQRRSWLQRFAGESPLAGATRIAALTAVIVLAVLVGLQLNNLLPDVGETSPSRSGIASASPSTSPSVEASPSATPAADCVKPPVDLISLINAADPVACYGNASATVDGEIIASVADCPPEVTVVPVWLSCPQAFLGLIGETRKVGAPMLTVAIDPASGTALGDPNTAVRVTGHFDDPAAQTCKVTEWLLGGSPPPQQETIEFCRATFVVTDVVPLAAAATGTLTWVAGAADGPGLSVSEAIASAPMEQVLVNGWLLIDGFGRTWLCEAIYPSAPPRLNGPRLLVENYPDSTSPDFREADGVRWIPDPIQLFGNVSVP